MRKLIVLAALSRVEILILLLVFAVGAAHGQNAKHQLNIQKTTFSLIADTLVRADLSRSLMGFLAARKDESIANRYVDSAYLKIDPVPFLWLRNAEGTKDGNDQFEPTLLAVLPLENERYLLKIAFLSIAQTAASTPKLNMIATLEARKVGGSYYFSNAIVYNTRNFQRKRVGRINYIYAHGFNQSRALKMDRFNSSIAKKFKTKPLTITYYKCDDPEQLFKMLGYDYIENMYYSKSGGLAEYWRNTLFAGNGSELYVHELVHFYLGALYPQASRVVDEGYATFLGGSGDVDLEKLAIAAKQYIKANRGEELYGLATNFKVRLTTGVPISYILSAIICKDIEDKLGFKALTTMFEPLPNETYIDTLKRTNGVGKEKFDSYLLELLNAY